MKAQARSAVWQGPIRPADDLWLIAHERDWQCRLHPRALGLALAGGLLGELLLAGCIAIASDDEVEVRDAGPPYDAFLHVMLAYIWSEKALDVRTWLRFFGEEKARALVIERMRLAGLAEDVEVSRLRRRTARAVWPSNIDAAYWRPIRLRHVILGSLPSLEAPTWADIILAGLVQAVGLLPAVLWENHAQGDAWLHELIIERASPDLQRLFAAVHTLVGDAVLNSR